MSMSRAAHVEMLGFAVRNSNQKAEIRTRELVCGSQRMGVMDYLPRSLSPSVMPGSTVTEGAK